MSAKRAIIVIGAELAMAASIGVAGLVGLSGKAEADTVMVCTIANRDGQAYADNCDYYELPACEYEDGNPDAQPCVWTSPRTGQRYYNDGTEYAR